MESKIIKFPSDQTESTYIETVKKRFTEYRDVVANLEPSPIGNHIKSLSGKIDKLCSKLEDSINAYLLGDSHQSYEALRQGISEIDSEFRLWYSQKISTDDTRKLFGIRVKKYILSDKKELFHIPFHLRHLVKTQRYSIPGVPCLYFGSSSYIAWKEMLEPELNTVHISRFEAREPIKILNFGYDHRAIRNLITQPQSQENPATLIGLNAAPLDNKFVQLAVSWFAIFPLLLATSIRRKNPGSDFCDAYILPQNLMQFIRNDKEHYIDGVRYVSTKFKDEIDSLKIPHCWAFPVKTTGNVGHCSSLTRLFSNTVIQSWQFSDQLDGGDINNGIIKENIEYMPGHIQPYNETVWGRSEAALLKLTATPI